MHNTYSVQLEDGIDDVMSETESTLFNETATAARLGPVAGEYKGSKKIGTNLQPRYAARIWLKSSEFRLQNE